MSSIVLELQRDALDPTVQITDLLRKAFTVARKLGIAEFRKWTENEISGYRDISETPEYRKISGTVKAFNPFHGWQPVLLPNNEFEMLFKNQPCGQSMAEIASLLEHDLKSGSLTMPFRAETHRLLQKSIGHDMQVGLFFSRTDIVRIIDSVRTTILNWSLKLEEDGIVGEGLSFTNQERETAEKASYNINNFYAEVHSSQIQQQTSHSSQVINGLANSSIREFADDILKQIDKLDLGVTSKEELIAEINTIKTQTDSPHPKQLILKECLYSIRRILESTGGGVAVLLLAQLAKMIV